MASTQRLFVRILQAVIYRIWVVLFFLSVFSLVTILNHWWGDITALYQFLKQLAISTLGTLG